MEQVPILAAVNVLPAERVDGPTLLIVDMQNDLVVLAPRKKSSRRTRPPAGLRTDGTPWTCSMPVPCSQSASLMAR